MTSIYYNEIDPYCAAWLQNLMDAGHIAKGVIDTRSIEDVRPDELAGYTQCHFFAGLGGWAYALDLAGWPRDRPVWTGSCPCQPFSAAGRGKGTSDSRHLWPHFFRLIKACRPSVVFGEQVASADVLGRATGKKDYLSYLQDREALRGIPHGWAAPEVQGHLQRLSERTGAEKTFAEVLLDCRATEDVEVEQSRQCVGFIGALPGPGAVTGFRSGLDGDSGSHQRGVLRVDRAAVQSHGQTQFSFARPDRPSEGVHDGQHPSGVDVREPDAEQLGGREDFGDSRRTAEQTIDDQRGATDKADVGDDEPNSGKWIDIVFNDLESSNYACASVAFPSAGIGAPHIRDRTYWVADANNARLEGRQLSAERATELAAGARGVAGGMANPKQYDCGREAATTNHRQPEADRPTNRAGGHSGSSVQRPGPTNGLWRAADWIGCTDGKWRPVEPGTFPLVDGAPARVGRLRAYGNAINAEAARAFIESYCEARGITTTTVEAAA